MEAAQAPPPPPSQQEEEEGKDSAVVSDVGAVLRRLETGEADKLIKQVRGDVPCRWVVLGHRQPQHPFFQYICLHTSKHTTHKQAFASGDGRLSMLMHQAKSAASLTPGNRSVATNYFRHTYTRHTYTRAHTRSSRNHKPKPHTQTKTNAHNTAATPPPRQEEAPRCPRTPRQGAARRRGGTPGGRTASPRTWCLGRWGVRCWAHVCMFCVDALCAHTPMVVIMLTHLHIYTYRGVRFGGADGGGGRGRHRVTTGACVLRCRCLFFALSLPLFPPPPHFWLGWEQLCCAAPLNQLTPIHNQHKMN